MEHEFEVDLILFDENDKLPFSVRIEYDASFTIEPSFVGHPDNWTEGEPGELQFSTIEIEFAEGVWLTIKPGDFEYFTKQFDTENLFEVYGEFLENCHCSSVDY